MHANSAQYYGAASPIAIIGEEIYEATINSLNAQDEPITELEDAIDDALGVARADSIAIGQGDENKDEWAEGSETELAMMIVVGIHLG